MKITKQYLAFIMLQEREWNTPTANPDSFEIDNFVDVLAQKTGIETFEKIRHTLQPSMYDLYIKNSLGDYMGRPDTMNNQTMRHIGFKEFQKDLEDLKKKIKFAQKIKNKPLKNFFGDKIVPGEASGPDVDDGGDGGGDGGDGGGGDGGGMS